MDYSSEQAGEEAGSATGIAMEDVANNDTRARKGGLFPNHDTPVGGSGVGSPSKHGQKRQLTIAKFHNKLFSYHDVGSLEIFEGLDDVLMDEMVVSLIAVLVMVQSMQLSSRVVFGC